MQLRRIMTARRYDHVVVLSKADQKTFRRFMRNVSNIYNPLTITPKPVEDYGVKRAIAVGRIDRQKGYDYLVEAWALVRETHPDWHLDIYGSSVQKDIRELQEQIDRLGLSDVVTLCGSSGDIAEEYAHHSLLIFSSRYEGFGLVLVEAAACGLPLVSYKCKQGPAEIVDDGNNGYLVSPVGNVYGLANAICRLASDAELRRRMGNRARDLAIKFSIDKIVAQWDDLFKELYAK